MYQIGNLIICGDSGVCRIEAVGKLDVPWIDKSKPYYTLCPIYREGKIFVPIDTNIFMRPVITCAEVQHLINIIPTINEIDCLNNSYKVLKEHYNKLLQTHNCTDLIILIKTICVRNGITINQGKQLGQIDSKFIKKAEELLYGEFAVALEIPKEKVKSYIEDRVNELANRHASK